MSAILKEEIEEGNKYMGSLQGASDNGKLEKAFLDSEAFSKATAVKLFGKLDVQAANANAKTPTRLMGQCQISGLKLSEFLQPQRDAFKSAIAASSGAMEEQVFINNVFSTTFVSSTRRRLRGDNRRLAAQNIVVEFSIVVNPESESDEQNDDEGLPAGAVVLIVLCILLGIGLIVMAVVIFYWRLKKKQQEQVGVMKDVKHISIQKKKSSRKGKTKSIEMSSKRNFSDVSVI